jgi:hypothetical protein
MSHDGAHFGALGSPATPVIWLSPQRPVEGGTVFVRPPAEQHPVESITVSREDDAR